MLATLYINGLQVDTLKDNKIIYVDIVKLWKTLKIREYYVPIPANLELITNNSDRSYTIGNYCTTAETMTSLLSVPPEAYEQPAIGEVMKRGLVEVLDRFWSAQPEFSSVK